MVRTLHKTNLVTILFTIFFLRQALSQYHFAANFCVDKYGNYTNGSQYKTNLNLLLPNLVHQASLSLFNNYTVGEGIDDEVYGIYLCRGDLDNQQCHDCVKSATISITERCLVQKEVIFWYDECMVRYSNRNIFKLEDRSLLTYQANTLNSSSDPEKYGEAVGKAMNVTILEAAYNKTKDGYATGEANIKLFETVYIMAQCTPDILGNLCERCLRVALRNMAGCCGTARKSMRMYFPSCWLRYEDSPFINQVDDGAAPAPEPTESLPRSNSSSSFTPPSPKGTSTKKTLSPICIGFALWLLVAVGIPNNRVA